MRPAPPRGTGPRRRPGRAEETAEPRAAPGLRPDPAAASGRGAGRGGLCEYLPRRSPPLPRSLCALGFHHEAARVEI